MGILGRLFAKKDSLIDPVYLKHLKTDLHSHLIPGIDDGSPDIETSIILLKKFIDLGYQKVITTPHIMSDYYRNTPEIINKGLDLVRKEIDAQKLPIEIDAAAEYNLEPNFTSLLKEKNILSFGPQIFVFFVLTFSIHKVPFVQFTISDGDLSGLTDLSKRMIVAGDNLRQSLFIFLPVTVLSIAQGIDNLFLAQIWFALRILYLFGHIINLYKYPLIRPTIWIPSIVVLVMMALNIVN